jgi:hypothetical protein
MPVDIQIIRACEFVRMGSHGEFDFDSTHEVLMTLAAACHKRGVERALLDVRNSTSNLTPDDLGKLIRGFSKAVATKRFRLAVLHTEQQNYRATLFAFFGAMVGRKVRASVNFEDALGWLSTPDDLNDESDGSEEVPIKARTTIPVEDPTKEG